MYMYILVSMFIPLLLHKVYLPTAKTGFRQLTQGLLSETFLEAHVSKLLALMLEFICIHVEHIAS